MAEPFLDALADRVILADGAMGTQLYVRGVFVNRCFDELNVSEPELVAEVHDSYVAAGSDLICTNTYGANRLRLNHYGMGEQVEAVNVRGVEIAVACARGRAHVAGTMGPFGRDEEDAPLADRQEAFREQAGLLSSAGADVILLETFFTLVDLELALGAVREASDLPIIAEMALPAVRHEDREIDPVHLVHLAERMGVAAVGVNCTTGPARSLAILETMSAATDLALTAMPNAGLPERVEGRTLYLASPEYMAEWGRRYVQKGARIVGGCCGTTPQMIRTMHDYIRSVGSTTATVAPIAAEASAGCEPVPREEKSEFARAVHDHFTVSVELDPPRGLDAGRCIEGAKLLKEAGIDVINMADGPRAVPRMGPMAMATLIQQQVGMDTVIHYCCRDRNVLALQMDLIGAHALGHHNILVITGDPPKMGSYPDATAVFDFDAVELLRRASLLNRGLDFAGEEIGEPTALFLGAGCNPGAVEPALEADRYAKKLEAGAEYFFSQPVFDLAHLEDFLDRTAHCPEVPFLVGILPLASYRNAVFLTENVPGMEVPPHVQDRLKRFDDRDSQREEGIAIAREVLEEAVKLERITGTYIYPPFGNYEAVLRVLEGIDRF